MRTKTAALVLAVAAGGAGAAQAAPLRGVWRLANSDGFYAPALAVNASGLTVAAWSGPGGADVHFVFRSAAGRFGRPVVIREASVDALDVGLASDGRAVLVWQAPSSVPGSVSAIRAATLWPNGHRSAVQMLSGDGTEPALATNGRGDAVVVWQQLSRLRFGQNPRVVETASLRAGGRAFSTAKAISGGTALDASMCCTLDFQPSVAISPSGDAIAAWRRAPALHSLNLEVATRLSGQAFAPPEVLASTTAGALRSLSPDFGGGEAYPQVKINADGAALVAWSGANPDDSAQFIQASFRLPGAAFETPVALETPSNYSAQPPAVTFTGPTDQAAVLWTQALGDGGCGATGEPEIAWRDPDGTFTSAHALAGPSGDLISSPSIAASPFPGVVFATWQAAKLVTAIDPDTGNLGCGGGRARLYVSRVARDGTLQLNRLPNNTSNPAFSTTAPGRDPVLGWVQDSCGNCLRHYRQHLLTDPVGLFG